MHSMLSMCVYGDAVGDELGFVADHWGLINVILSHFGLNETYFGAEGSFFGAEGGH